MPASLVDPNFVQRLRDERERLGLTQAHFAQLGGVSRLAQWKYENGDNVPSVEYLLALVKSGVDVIYLIRGRRVSDQEIDWDIVRDAFLFVQRNMASKPGKNFSAEQLFDAFKEVWTAAMDDTYRIARSGMASEEPVASAVHED